VNIAISADRVAQDIERIASFSEAPPTVGFSRPTFTSAWSGAVGHVISEAKMAGCDIRVDAAGNIHARSKASGWEKRVWLSGSHIDSVPTGGKFDGVVGVVAALEVLRASPNSNLELIIFAEEEGTTFNLGMLGSRAWVGSLSEEVLRGLKNRDGKDYLAAGAKYGVNPDVLARDPFDPSKYFGLIELHIEQGPAMWNAGVPVAVVTAINGRQQYLCTVTGTPNHAGSTKMGDRKDALACAAEMVSAIEYLGRELNAVLDHTVITVGRLIVEPNGLNVIPGRVTFSVDFRAREDGMLSRGASLLRERLEGIASSRSVGFEMKMTEELPAVALDAGVCGRLREAGQRMGVSLSDVASGALHDAAILAPLIPTAMLFIASEGGISHNPAEFSRLEDIVLATRILAEAVSA
jgi:allantoate deiminase